MRGTVSLERSFDVRFLLDDGGVLAVSGNLEGRGRNPMEALVELKRKFEQQAELALDGLQLPGSPIGSDGREEGVNFQVFGGGL